MSSASTTQPQDTEVREAAEGHGRHRGPVSTQETEATPRGRHRKPAEQHAGTAAA
ncbi:hypothetical protein JS756_12175 [Streptomyces actuosus]|uniref:Uncharacterized protein n=1 Tax=Streptomyces actuosus TaxID=1885 RepID=A0ABS2VP85_STRAS|nr:hypothetical protein [Streptomyces actuosus]MBN0044854.1 hypothetical protein [Streptomyces actuosus]